MLRAGGFRRLLSMRPGENAAVRTADEYPGWGKRRGYASPAVSNMAASIASRALLPAQTTNWNEGK